MKRIIVAIALALLTCMTAITVATQRVAPINGLYVFGDSLSDIGTVFQATGGVYPANPPYFQGRYSNGRVWVEYLADRLQLSTAQMNNFAWGGATSGADPTSMVPGMTTQVTRFTQTQPSLNDQALYILWAGANDYLQGASTTQPVANITGALTTLMNAGAKRFLVANLPDLGQLPATATTANASALSNITQAHNQQLRRSLKSIQQQHSGLDLVMFDVNTLYRTAITNPTEFGFTNVAQACVAGSQICHQPGQFLFWDGIHPTTAAHKILGEKAFTALEATLPSNQLR